jgi:hypothetical protein
LLLAWTNTNKENSLDDILNYYVFVTEWIWAVLDTRVEGKVGVKAASEEKCYAPVWLFHVSDS